MVKSPWKPDGEVLSFLVESESARTSTPLASVTAESTSKSVDGPSLPVEIVMSLVAGGTAPPEASIAVKDEDEGTTRQLVKKAADRMWGRFMMAP